MNALTDLVDSAVRCFCNLWPEGWFFHYAFNVHGLLAILMVALVCGAIGSLVVGNRMAFFSDALAHTAFAGMAFALILFVFILPSVANVRDWTILIMIIFGIVVGLGIAWVQERTSLASDTVIGVFFAGAIGFGAVFMKAVAGHREFFSLENFLFGDPLTTTAADLLYLFLLVIATALFLIFIYNPLVFTTFNVSLARSRRIRIRVCNYLFIAFLGVIVNLCLHIVGALLINALLIVPAATAANISRNMRQMFWWSIVLCLTVGCAGQIVSWELVVPGRSPGSRIQFGTGGIIVVLSVLLFFLSIALGPLWRDRRRPC
jgi:zinc transport system permease protein